MRLTPAFLLSAFLFSATSAALADGLEAKGDYFPIAVWLQAPRNIARYQAIGINTYVGLWDGPTEAQLTALEKAGMNVVCDQNAEALKPRWNKVIAGWLQEDEPDNAQSLGKGKGYGPPVPPEKVVARYKAMKSGDPAGRPVLLNLGQAVAWDGWHGRGVRTNKPEDYPEYVKAGDILSFDIYPVTHDRKEVAGKLWYVGYGTRRLVQWVDGKKPVWACIETTHISNAARRPTPDQVRSEVWMAIIHGARGITYFAHEFAPKFVEAGLLADELIAKKVGEINAEIRSYAKVINDGSAIEGVKIDGGEVALLARRGSSDTYIFAVSMTDARAKVTFTVPGLPAGDVEAVGEKRTIKAVSGGWADEFDGYQVHVYRVKG